ncbi:MAG: hypothetical protein ACK5PP_15465 [Acidimicrobiales bacterium]
MTDDPLHLDELASSSLDGEATEAEQLRIENEPELQERMAALRSVADAVATAPVPPPDPQRREHDLAAALDAFDSLGTAERPSSTWLAAGTGPTPSGPTAEPSTISPGPSPQASATPPQAPGAPRSGGDVADLAVRRDRSAARARSSRWLGLAAGLVIVVGGSWAAVSAFGSSDETSADLAAPPPAVAPSEEGASAAADAAPSSTAALVERDDGAVADSTESSDVAGNWGDGEPFVTPSWPAVRDLQTAARYRLPPEESACSTEIVSEPGEVAVAFIPLLAGDLPGEAVVLRTAGGVERFVVVDENCQAV